MSNIDTLSSVLPPFRDLPAAEIKLTWRDNTTGVKELTYGPRDPAQRGYQREHDHADKGGVHLGMALERYSWGPYTRSKGDLDPGIPICPSLAGVSFATGQAKLLTSVPCRILGGVTGVHVDMMFIPELSTSPQPLVLGVVLRPTDLVNFNEFTGAIAESAFTKGALKKLAVSLSTSTKQRVTFTDLSRLGPSFATRRCELCFFLMSDLDANNLIHLCAATVLVSAVTTDITPLTQPANQEVPLAQLVAGQPLLSGLASQARARGNALNLSVLSQTPGYVSGIVDTVSAWTQALTGAHQHQGAKIVQSDGTYQSDGALLPYSLFGQGYPQLGESGSDLYTDANPCTGIKVSRTGVIGQQLVFFQEVPLAAGAKRILFVFAMRPETSSPKTRLALSAHLCRANVAPSSTNNVIVSVNEGSSPDSLGFVTGNVEPAPTPGYQPTGQRSSQGLGNWTRDAELAQAQAPNGVRLTNCYRISLQVELLLADTVRATEPYALRYQFLLYDSATESSLDSGAGLVWAGAIATE